MMQIFVEFFAFFIFGSISVDDVPVAIKRKKKLYSFYLTSTTLHLFLAEMRIRFRTRMDPVFI